MKQIIFPLFAILAAISLGRSAQAQDGVVFDTGEVTVLSGETSNVFSVEIADSPEETAQGLMFREEMAENAGMLFDFGEPRDPQMWMKNTLISLDMLFLDTDGTVVMIAKHARPGSLRRISPGVAVKGVLELNGGAADKFGIKAGDKVVHEIFESAEES